MITRLAGTTFTAAALLLAVGCSHQPSAASQPTPMAGAQAAADSVDAERLAQGRADSIARAAEQARATAMSHADSVRDQVQGEITAEPAPLSRWGLALPDSVAMADKLHFNFNEADLSVQDLARLEHKRQVLVARPDLVIEIDGNADERGADEYNLALGLRRAAAAQRWLVAHGIVADRISIRSYGEERPLDSGHNEAAWARNRRDDFLVTRPAAR
jgi:peptidoglycan-associated lipoprotein